MGASGIAIGFSITTLFLLAKGGKDNTYSSNSHKEVEDELIDEGYIKEEEEEE